MGFMAPFASALSQWSMGMDCGEPLFFLNMAFITQAGFWLVCLAGKISRMGIMAKKALAFGNGFMYTGALKIFPFMTQNT